MKEVDKMIKESREFRTNLKKRDIVIELISDERKRLELDRQVAFEYIDSHARRLQQAIKNTEYYLSTNFELYQNSGEAFNPKKVEDLMK